MELMVMPACGWVCCGRGVGLGWRMGWDGMLVGGKMVCVCVSLPLPKPLTTPPVTQMYFIFLPPATSMVVSVAVVVGCVGWMGGVWGVWMDRGVGRRKGKEWRPGRRRENNAAAWAGEEGGVEEMVLVVRGRGCSGLEGGGEFVVESPQGFPSTAFPATRDDRSITHFECFLRTTNRTILADFGRLHRSLHFSCSFNQGPSCLSPLKACPPFFLLSKPKHCHRSPPHKLMHTHNTHIHTAPPPASTRNLPPPSLHIMKLLPLCVTLAALMPVVSAVSPLKQRKQATAVKVRARQRRGRGGGGPRWREWMWTCVA